MRHCAAHIDIRRRSRGAANRTAILRVMDCPLANIPLFDRPAGYFRPAHRSWHVRHSQSTSFGVSQ